MCKCLLSGSMWPLFKLTQFSNLSIVFDFFHFRNCSSHSTFCLKLTYYVNCFWRPNLSYTKFTNATSAFFQNCSCILNRCISNSEKLCPAQLHLGHKIHWLTLALWLRKPSTEARALESLKKMEGLLHLEYIASIAPVCNASSTDGEPFLDHVTKHFCTNVGLQAITLRIIGLDHGC